MLKGLGSGLTPPGWSLLSEKWRGIIWKGINYLGQHIEFYNLYLNPSLYLLPAARRILQPFLRTLSWRFRCFGGCIACPSRKIWFFFFFIWFVFSIPLPSFFASSSILGRGFAAGQVWLWYFGKKISSKCLKYTLVHLQNPKQNRCKLICNWNSGLGKFRKWVPLSRIAFLKQNSSGLPDCWLLRRKVWRAARGRQWVSGKWISGSSELQSWQAALSEEEVWES